MVLRLLRRAANAVNSAWPVPATSLQALGKGVQVAILRAPAARLMASELRIPSTPTPRALAPGTPVPEVPGAPPTSAPLTASTAAGSDLLPPAAGGQPLIAEAGGELPPSSAPGDAASRYESLAEVVADCERQWAQMCAGGRRPIEFLMESLKTADLKKAFARNCRRELLRVCPDFTSRCMDKISQAPRPKRQRARCSASALTPPLLLELTCCRSCADLRPTQCRMPVAPLAKRAS